MKWKQFALRVLLAGFFGCYLTAYAQAQKGSGQTPAPASGNTTPGGDASKYFQRDWNKLMTQGRGGDYLIGNVVVTGGSLPWEPIAISVNCNDKTSFTTSSDSKGYFLIAHSDPIGSTGVKADAKPVASQFVGCSVVAFLPGFSASNLKIANRHVLDSPNIGTITLRREAGAGTALSDTSAGAPAAAAKEFEKARSDWLDNHPDRAQKSLRKAVELYPNYAEAWYELGKIQETKNPQDAGNFFSKAIAADPKFGLAYEHLAAVSAAAQNWQAVVEQTNHALELNPRGSINIWFYRALGNYQLGYPGVAQASAEKALAMDPLHVQLNTEQLLAVMLAEKSEFAASLQHLRNCLAYYPPGPNLELVKQQIVQIEASAAASK